MKSYNPDPSQHKLHMAVATVPALILLTAFIIDLVNLPTNSREPTTTLAQVVVYLIVAGLITMIIASIPGLADYTPLRAGEPVRSVAIQHLAFTVLSFLAFGGSLITRLVYPTVIGPPLVPLGMAAFGIGFLAYSCYLGYRMMHPVNDEIDPDMITYDRIKESRAPQRDVPTTPPGATAAVNSQWKKAEADAQRWRVEPRVDADGDSV